MRMIALICDLLSVFGLLIGLAYALLWADPAYVVIGIAVLALFQIVRPK